MVVGTAHSSPASGVKTYSNNPATSVAITAGSQVPLMPLSDISGNASGVAFWQYGPSAANTGSTSSVMSMVMVVGMAHSSPTSGVKVYSNDPATSVAITARF